MHAIFDHLTTRQSHRAWRKILTRHPDLATWPSPDALLVWLHKSSENAAEKNAVLHKLLSLLQSDLAAYGVLIPIMLLALWPGLRAIRNRLRPFHRGRMRDLDADLVAQLAFQLHGADPKQVKRVAATLLRNVERDLRRASRKEALRQFSQSPLDASSPITAPEQATPNTLRVARAAIRTLGDDGALLVAVDLFGFTQKEAGAQLGLSEANARKRYQRVHARLRRKYAALM